MIISHKYKFIFIKTRKTAGTSIEVFLSGVCGENDVVGPLGPAEESHRPRNYKNLRGLNVHTEHAAAGRIKSCISKSVWNNYFKFCVERNPWDKAISYYYSRKYYAVSAIPPPPLTHY